MEALPVSVPAEVGQGSAQKCWRQGGISRDGSGVGGTSGPGLHIGNGRGARHDGTGRLRGRGDHRRSTPAERGALAGPGVPSVAPRKEERAGRPRFVHRPTAGAATDRARRRARGELAHRSGRPAGHRVRVRPCSNPSLVYCSISAFGQAGPYAHLALSDGIVNAKTGRMRDQVGHQENRPTYRAVNDTSYHTAMFCVQAILAGLRVVAQTGLGQHIETSLLSGTTAPKQPVAAPRRERTHPLISIPTRWTGVTS